LACTGLITASAPAQTFTGLGLLPGGDFSTGAGTNADGSVCVGSSNTSIGDPRAFRRVGSGGIVNLGVPPGGIDSFAYSVSGNGLVVVGDSLFSTGFVLQAFRWVSSGGGGSGVMTSLGTLPGGAESSAFAANQTGSVVVGVSSISSGDDRAFRWTSAGMVNLGALPGGLFSGATGVSGDGLSIAGYSDTPDGVRAFRWTGNAAGAGVMADLGTPPDGFDSYAAAISADGSTVAGNGSFPAGTFATVWTSAAGMVMLPALQDGFEAFAYGVSGDGAVIVGKCTLIDGDRAFVWSAETSTLDLETYLQTLGINLTGWRLTAANGVSTDATTIVGKGFHNGVEEAWVATIPSLVNPCSPCIADFNQDGGVTGDDVRDFFGVWSIGEPCGDTNQDGGVDGADVERFFTRWELGLC